MKREEIKKMMVGSLINEAAAGETWEKLEEAGASFEFGAGFREKVMDRLFTAAMVVSREVEFLRSWNYAFMRIALTGVAAIVILLISLYLIDGSFSVNSILGLHDNYDESIVCLLTGN